VTGVQTCALPIWWPITTARWGTVLIIQKVRRPRFLPYKRTKEVTTSTSFLFFILLLLLSLLQLFYGTLSRSVDPPGKWMGQKNRHLHMAVAKASIHVLSFEDLPLTVHLHLRQTHMLFLPFFDSQNKPYFR